MLGVVLPATATVVASILGSLTVVEYRLYRERQWDSFRDKKQWLIRAEQLTDQIIRECTDLNGRVRGRKTRQELVADGTLTPLDERVQQLKDHISEAPFEIDSNLKYRIDDVWVKYALLDPALVTMDRIERYPQASAEACNEAFSEEIENLEEPPTLFDYLRSQLSSGTED